MDDEQRKREETRAIIESLTNTARLVLERAMELADEHSVPFEFRFGDGWDHKFEASYDPEGDFTVVWLSSNMRC